jgi:CRP-like cAMP-binding protein
MEDF